MSAPMTTRTTTEARSPSQARAHGELGALRRWRRRGPLLPALVLTILLTQIPLLGTIFYSFGSHNLMRPGTEEFVGLDNYVSVFADAHFRNAVWNTVVLTTTTILLSIVLGVALAMLLDRKFVGRRIVRTLLITPFLVMPAASALLWKHAMLNPTFGMLNWGLSLVGIAEVDWVSRFPMASIVLMLVWQWTPFMMLIVLAGLQSQSTEQLEAARVDGAGEFATFWLVTLPHLRRFIELSVLLGSIFIVQTFDPIFLITQGGPGQATTNLPYFIYQLTFRAFEVGEAAAAGVIVVIGTILLVMFALRVITGLFREEGE